MQFPARTNKDRKLEVNWDLVNTYLSRYKPGTYFRVEIKRKQKTVSDPMRRLYFSVVLSTYGEHLGYDKHELELLHRQLKITFYQIKPDSKGIYRNVPHVFSNESKIEISGKRDFMNWVIRAAAHDGCYIDIEGDGYGA